MMILISFSIVNGIPLKHLTDVHGLKVSENTWTACVKDTGMVCAEYNERNRRDTNQKYQYAQIDETAFGKRKYNRGSRRRKPGVQWALTIVKVSFPYFYSFY